MDYLRALPLVDRARLLDGDWDIVEGGNLFRREWFGILAAAPVGDIRYCRYWDLAGTAPSSGRDPDFTVGALMGAMLDGSYAVFDVVRARLTPAGVESLVNQVAHSDERRYGPVAIRMEQEPGSAGVMVVDRFTRHVLPGFDFGAVSPTGEKSVRAKPFSAQVEAGNVRLVAGAWNQDFLNELVAFPAAGVHDDQVDAVCGAFEELCKGTPFQPVFGGEAKGWMDGLR